MTDEQRLENRSTFHTQFAENQRHREEGFLKTLPLLGAVVFGYAYVAYNFPAHSNELLYAYTLTLVLLIFGCWITAILSQNFRRDQKICARIRGDDPVFKGYAKGTQSHSSGFWMPDFYFAFYILLFVVQILLTIHYLYNFDYKVISFPNKWFLVPLTGLIFDIFIFFYYQNKIEPTVEKKPVILDEQIIHTTPKSNRTRLSSSNALKTVYYVIIGLSIQEALRIAFLDDSNKLIGLNIILTERWTINVLFIALLFTVIRFVHGASIHLDDIDSTKYKLLTDFFGFFTQGCIFYLMANSLMTANWFCILFASLALLDTIWLLFIFYVHKLKSSTMKQWVTSNICIFVVLLGVLLFDYQITSSYALFVVFSISILATAWDYWSNKDFYFPPIDTV